MAKRAATQAIKVTAVLISAIAVGACATLYDLNDALGKVFQGNTPFTREAVMEIRQDMREKEVLDMFGLPDRRSIRTIGPESKSGPWQALIYVYVLPPNPRGKYQEDNNENTFYFSRWRNEWLLNHWEIELAF